MFIDAYFEWPWVLSHRSPQVGLLVEPAMEQSRRAAVGTSHRLQVAEVLTRPEKAPSVALGGAIALANPLDGFGERTSARAADEAAFANPDERLVVSNRVVAKFHPAVVVHAARQGGAPGADLELGRLLREQQHAAFVGFSVLEPSEFRQQQVPR